MAKAQDAELSETPRRRRRRNCGRSVGSERVSGAVRWAVRDGRRAAGGRRRAAGDAAGRRRRPSRRRARLRSQSGRRCRTLLSGRQCALQRAEGWYPLASICLQPPNSNRSPSPSACATTARSCAVIATARGSTLRDLAGDDARVDGVGFALRGEPPARTARALASITASGSPAASAARPAARSPSSGSRRSARRRRRH